MGASVARAMVVIPLAALVSASSVADSHGNAFLGGGAWPQPEQLRRVTSINCLKTKLRRGWQADCTSGDPPAKTSKHAVLRSFHPTLDNYPNWKDARCRSGGQLLCDPWAALDEPSRVGVASKLAGFWRDTHVECGQLASKLTNRQESFPARFRLGVAIANEWPASEADPETLQKFGLILLARWGLLQWYNGVDINVLPESYNHHEYAANCPSAAIVILLPKYRQVFLSSPSCEFICQTRGGDQVVANATAAWDRAGEGSAGVAAAANAAIDAVHSLLKDALPLSLEHDSTMATATRRKLDALEKHLFQSETFWFVLVRSLLGLFWVAAVAMIACGVAFLFAPTNEKALRRIG